MWLAEGGYICNYDWFVLMYGGDRHNIVMQLSSNKYNKMREHLMLPGISALWYETYTRGYRSTHLIVTSVTQNLIWELMSPKSRVSHVSLEPQSQEWWLPDLSSDMNEPPPLSSLVCWEHTGVMVCGHGMESGAQLCVGCVMLGKLFTISGLLFTFIVK